MGGVISIQVGADITPISVMLTLQWCFLGPQDFHLRISLFKEWKSSWIKPYLRSMIYN